MTVIKRNGLTATNTGLEVNTGKCIKCGYKIPDIWCAGDMNVYFADDVPEETPMPLS